MRRLLGVCVCAALAGCGGRAVVPVSGVVTMDGKPLANARVNFQPIGTLDRPPGPGSYGKTDERGRYTLRLIQPDRAGAVVGKHRVTISQLGGEQSHVADGGVVLPKDPVPARYNTNSDLEFEVRRGGTDSADFKLESR